MKNVRSENRWLNGLYFSQIGLTRPGKHGKRDINVPSSAPTYLELIVYSSSVIGFFWKGIPENETNGNLIGHTVCWYDSRNDVQKYTFIEPHFRRFIMLDGLQPATTFTFTVCAETSEGCGPWSRKMTARTESDVPSRPPKNVTSMNMTSTTSALVEWGPIPHDHVNGDLKGYRLTYTLVVASELEVIEPESIELFVEKNTFHYRLQDLRPNSIYKIQIAGETDAGFGVEDVIYTETCRCPKTLYTNYRAMPPYLRHNKSTGKISGIFPRIVKEMLIWSCGLCTNGHNDTVIEMRSSGSGKPSLKDNYVQVLEDMDDTPITFPINSNKRVLDYKGLYPYVPLVDSPGIAFLVVREQLRVFTMADVTPCLPFLLYLVTLAFIFGVFIWIFEFRAGNKEFPQSFIQGAAKGFWMTIITMTTVGYGDVKAKSVIGRLITILATFTGLIMVGIYLAVLTYTMIITTIDKKFIVYGTKIAALENSTEYRIGVLRNAILDPKRKYLTIAEIKRALDNGVVKGALIDTYVAAEERDLLLLDDTIKVQQILDKEISYGIVLSGEAEALQKRCYDYVIMNSAYITSAIVRNTNPLKPSKQRPTVSRMAGLLDLNSVTFRNALKWAGIAVAVAVTAGLCWSLFCWYKNSRISPHKRRYMAFITGMRKFGHDEYHRLKAWINTQKERIRRNARQVVQLERERKRQERATKEKGEVIVLKVLRQNAENNKDEACTIPNATDYEETRIQRRTIAGTARP